MRHGATGSKAGTTPMARGAALRFEDVRFGYDPGRPVINGLDLDVPAVRRVAILGASGSDKSTLVRLLMRLHG